MKEGEVVERIQVYIPLLFDSLDVYPQNSLNRVKVVGVKKQHVKFIKESSRKDLRHIPLIASESFSIYDLQLDFNRNMLLFYINGGIEISREEILQQIFDAILVEYSDKKYGFFTSPRGKRKIESAL